MSLFFFPADKNYIEVEHQLFQTPVVDPPPLRIFIKHLCVCEWFLKLSSASSSCSAGPGVT